MTNESKREEYQDRHDALYDEQTELNTLAKQQHAQRTRSHYREDTGEEMDEFDSDNMADVAAIEAFDEFDANSGSKIDYDLRFIRPRIDGIADDTPVDELNSIGVYLNDVAEKKSASVVVGLGRRADQARGLLDCRRDASIAQY